MAELIINGREALKEWGVRMEMCIRDSNEEAGKRNVEENKINYNNSKKLIGEYEQVIGLWKRFGEDPNFHKNSLNESEKELADKYRNEMCIRDRYLTFRRVTTRVFKDYIGSVTGVMAGSINSRFGEKPIRERRCV